MKSISGRGEYQLPTPMPTPGWYIYNITRTGDGTIYISRNDELIITSTPAVQEWEFDEVVNTCDKFIFKPSDGASIDTIVVGSDLDPIIPFETTATDTTTTSTVTQTWTSGNTGTTDLFDPAQYLPIIGIAGVIFVVAVLIIMKRK
ncbi:MAG: hypothetical protein JW779_00830 [Candidatus Thorarchaeota archaeon]|nr:hypothetical protein [Candidatus Thorarchaeota archaeon]